MGDEVRHAERVADGIVASAPQGLDLRHVEITDDQVTVTWRLDAGWTWSDVHG